MITDVQFKKLKGSYPDIPAYPQKNGHVKVAAGWFIEQCGWKGKAQGPVSMYEKQALVMVNTGEATFADVSVLLNKVITSVKAEFGVQLEPEPIIVGQVR